MYPVYRYIGVYPGRLPRGRLGKDVTQWVLRVMFPGFIATQRLGKGVTQFIIPNPSDVDPTVTPIESNERACMGVYVYVFVCVYVCVCVCVCVWVCV